VYGGRIDIGAFEVQPDPPAGDYNYDNVVDAADFVVWRKFLGTSNDMPDGDDDGVVDQADGDIWSENYGASTPVEAAAEAALAPALASSNPAFTPRVAVDVGNRFAEESRPAPRPALSQVAIVYHRARTTRVDLLADASNALSGREPNVDGKYDDEGYEASTRADAIDAAFGALPFKLVGACRGAANRGAPPAEAI
jgi:hypothetical protein